MVTHPLWSALSALSLAPEPAATAPSDETIVVTGSKSTREAVARYVNSITAETDGQLARFREPICPAAVGLPESYNRAVEARLRRVAGSVGVRSAAAKCDPNLVVIVADGSAALIDRLRKERPDIFEGVKYPQVAAALRATGPVRTWQSIEPRGADGRSLGRLSSINGSPVSDGYMLGGTSDMSSRLSTPTRKDLVRSFVVIDVDAIDGLTLTQIADYAAMRLLARTRPPSRPTASTILGLFDDAGTRSRVAHLTRWDFAYLWSLYATDNGDSAGSQKSAIAGAIRDDVRQRSER